MKQYLPIIAVAGLAACAEEPAIGPDPDPGFDVGDDPDAPLVGLGSDVLDEVCMRAISSLKPLS